MLFGQSEVETEGQRAQTPPMSTESVPFLGSKAVLVSGDIAGTTLITMTKETFDDDPPEVRMDDGVVRMSTGTLLTRARETTDDDFTDDGERPADRVGSRRPFLAAFAVSCAGDPRGGTIITEARGETTDDRAS